MKPTEYNFPTLVRHVYDVDAFEIIDSLMDKYKSNIDQVPEHLRDLDFIKLEEEFLIKFLNEEGIDTLEHQKHRNFIIPSYYNLYNTYLGYKLLTIDLYKIEPLLSYQSVLFLGNYYATKDNFLGLIEFLVYDFVKVRLLPFEQIRLEKMVNWLERNRLFLLNKAYNEDSTTDNLREENIQPTAPKFKTVEMEINFANTLQEKLKAYFATEEHPSIFTLFFKGELTVPLCFNGQANQLAELFKRLRYNSKINVATLESLANWITTNFVIKNKQGEIEQLNISTISQVLKKSYAEPPKGKRILEDVAEFIVPNLRKKYAEPQKK